MMELHPATYFSPQYPEGIACQLVVEGDNAHVYFSREKGMAMLIWNIRLAQSCDFQGVELKMINADPAEYLRCSGAVAVQIINIRSSPKPLVKERRPLVTYSPFIISLLVITVIGFLIYSLVLPWLGRLLINRIPVEAEISLGETLSKQYSIGAQSNDSLNYYLNAYFNEIKPVSVYPFKIQVIVSEELNAFALPGGSIFVYSGLLKKMNTHEELAALLGHESAHILKRHSLKTIMGQAATGMVVSAVFGDISEVGEWIAGRAAEFKQLDYSRDLETEADDKGFELMLKNKIDPNGMLRLLDLLKKESAETPDLMKYLSTHPETDERISNIKSRAEINNSFTAHPKLSQYFLGIKRFL